MLSPAQESVVQAVPDSRQDMPGKTRSKYLVNSSIYNEYGCVFGKQASVSTSQVCLNTWKTRRKERGARLVDLLPVSLLPSRGLPLSAWVSRRFPAGRQSFGVPNAGLVAGALSRGRSLVLRGPLALVPAVWHRYPGSRKGRRGGCRAVSQRHGYRGSPDAIGGLCG